MNNPASTYLAGGQLSTTQRLAGVVQRLHEGAELREKIQRAMGCLQALLHQDVQADVGRTVCEAVHSKQPLSWIAGEIGSAESAKPPPVLPSCWMVGWEGRKGAQQRAAAASSC